MDTEISDFPTTLPGYILQFLAMDKSSRRLTDVVNKPMYLVPPCPSVKFHYDIITCIQLLRNKSFDPRFEI